MGRSVVLFVLCAGVVSCSLLSGASDLVVADDDPADAFPGRTEAGSSDGAVSDGSGSEAAAIDASTQPASGSVDTTYAGGGRALVGFGSNDQGRSASMLPDGTVVVGGRTGNGIPTNYALARLTPAGVLDPSFGTGGKVTLDFFSDYDEINAIAHTANGHIVAMGRSWNTTPGAFFVSGARFEANGTVDPSFGAGGKLQGGTPNPNNQDGTFAMLLRPGDAPAVAGSQFGNVAVSLFLATGAIDETTVPGGSAFGGPGVVRAMARQPDGKLVLAGWTPPYAEATTCDVLVERRLADLSPDGAFGANGRVTVDVGTLDHAYAVALAPDGKIVVAGDTRAGSDDDVLLLRFLANGQPDTTFGAAGRVVTALKAGPSAAQDRGRAVAIDASGRILVAGSTTSVKDQDVLVLRYTAKGALDPTFGDQGVVAPKAVGTEEARDLRLMTDGRIVIVGSATSNGDTDFLVQRFWP